MKTNNLARVIILNALMISASCSGMDYMRNAYSSLTNMIEMNMIFARHWTSNFMERCRKVSVLGTIYASFGIYDFQRITGLNEDALDTYSQEQLKQGMNRLEIMINYAPESKKLRNFSSKLFKAISAKEETELSYDEAAAIEAIKGELGGKNKNINLKNPKVFI